ncbi:MAG: metal-dependent transcriptional regulator [Bacilli bacterium]|nr:metal-dependent transcriptional regulator [Bacilli bacterium]
MRIQESGENYLETILILKSLQPEVHAIDVANYMSFSKPSISRALGILQKAGLIKISKSGAIELTNSGQKKATKIYDRHLTITKFLDHLGVDVDIAERDACKIEHVISEETFQAIKKQVK